MSRLRPDLVTWYSGVILAVFVVYQLYVIGGLNRPLIKYIRVLLIYFQYNSGFIVAVFVVYQLYVIGVCK